VKACRRTVEQTEEHLNKEVEAKATSASYPAGNVSLQGAKGRQLLKTLHESLPVELTTAELLATGAEAAKQFQEQATHAAHKKEVMAELKARETQIQAQVAALHSKLLSGREHREVQVEVYSDFERNVAVYVRTDSGEEIRTRALAADERQGMLDIESGEATEAGEPEP
jgi:hypothetical protein